MKKLFLKIKHAILRNYYAARMVLRTSGFTPQMQQQQMDIWPPTSGLTPGYVAYGKTTLKWGTDGLLQSPYPTSGGFYTLMRFNQKPIIDRTKLPNGTGITTSDIFLIDGASWEVTIRDDSTMPPLLIGYMLSIVDAMGVYGAPGLAYTARVVDPGYDTAPKQAGERTITADNLILIDSPVGSNQTSR